MRPTIEDKKTGAAKTTSGGCPNISARSQNLATTLLICYNLAVNHQITSDNFIFDGYLRMELIGKIQKITGR